MEASDEEAKWNFESSGDESGTAVEVPAVVLPKQKKPRSKAQLAIGGVRESPCSTRAANKCVLSISPHHPSPKMTSTPGRRHGADLRAIAVYVI